MVLVPRRFEIALNVSSFYIILLTVKNFYTVKKIKFCIKDFFSKWTKSLDSSGFGHICWETFNAKVRFFCCVNKAFNWSNTQILNFWWYSFCQQTEAATGVVLWKSCSLKFCNIHRKIPVLESLFNKVVGLLKKI